MEEYFCPLLESKDATAGVLADEAEKLINENNNRKINVIWIEATGCSGNIISFINGKHPDLLEVLTTLVNIRYNNTLMSAEGENAYLEFLNTLNSEFILMVDGAVSTRDNGAYNIIANYKGKPITALEAIKMAGEKAKYVIAVGTCASYGGISAARPNPSESKGLGEILGRSIIRIPGCPSHPDWVIGTLAHLVAHGDLELDEESRPIVFYGITIHDTCTRRGFFDKKLFAKQLGDEGCMFKLGCRGPVTKTDCPRRKWNGYVNWPIGDNSPCIGCAQKHFPDGMEPFIRF